MLFLHAGRRQNVCRGYVPGADMPGLRPSIGWAQRVLSDFCLVAVDVGWVLAGSALYPVQPRS